MHRLLCRCFDCGDSVHDFLNLFEGPGLDLAHALTRHTEFVSQLSKRHGVFGQAPALENAPGALIVVEEVAKAAFAAPAGMDELDRRTYDDSELIFVRSVS